MCGIEILNLSLKMVTVFVFFFILTHWTLRPYLEGTQDEVEHQPQLRFDVFRYECKYDEVYPEEWNQQQC